MLYIIIMSYNEYLFRFKNISRRPVSKDMIKEKLIKICIRSAKLFLLGLVINSIGSCRNIIFLIEFIISFEVIIYFILYILSWYYNNSYSWCIATFCLIIWHCGVSSSAQYCGQQMVSFYQFVSSKNISIVDGVFFGYHYDIYLFIFYILLGIWSRLPNRIYWFVTSFAISFTIVIYFLLYLI